MGFTKMIVGCLAANPTNDFYKYMGGKLIKQRVFEKLKLPENVYLFEKIWLWRYIAYEVCIFFDTIAKL